MTLDISPKHQELPGEFLTLAKRLAGGEIEEPELAIAVEKLPTLSQDRLDILAEFSQEQAHQNPKLGWAMARVGDVSAVTHSNDVFLRAKAAWYLGRAANNFFQPKLANEAIGRARDGFKSLGDEEWLAACDWQLNALPWARPNLNQCLTEVEAALKIISAPNSKLNGFQVGCCLTLAYVQTLLDQTKKAFENLDVCEDSYQVSQNQVGLIQCCLMRGHIYFRQSFYDEAISMLERGITLARANAALVEEALGLGRLGSVYYKRQVGSAGYLLFEATITEAINLFRQLDLKFWEVLYQQSFIDIYISRGDLSEATKVVEYCLPIMRDFNLDAPLVSTLIAKGWLETYKANYKEGVADLEVASALAQRVGNKYMLGVAYMHLGEIYLEMGRYQLALRYLEESLEICKALRNSSRVAECCLRLARCWRSVGRFDRALDTLNLVEHHAKLAKQENIFPYLYLRRAETYFDMGDTDSVIGALRKAIQAAVEIEDKIGAASSNRLLAEALIHSGKLDEVPDILEAAESIFLEAGLKVEQAGCKAAWGNYYLKLGERALARNNWQQAVGLANDIGLDVIWQVEAGLAGLESDAGNILSSLEHYRVVVRALNQLRQDMWQTAIGGFFLKRPIGVLEDAIRLGVAAGAYEDVLFFVEASKAQVLASQFKKPVLGNTKVDSPELSNLIGEIRWREKRLRGEFSEGETFNISDFLKIQSEFKQMVRTYEILRGQLERKQVTQKQEISLDMKAFDMAGFRDMADNNFGRGWAVLDYYSTEKQVYCVLISSHTFQVFELGYPDRIKFVMGSLDSLARTGDWQKEELDWVGRWLLPERVLEYLPRDKTVIIAPHRGLNFLPWPALTAGDIPLVGRSYPVIVPSVQSLTALMNRNGRDIDLDNGLILAISNFDGGHEPLPFVRREIESLQQIFPECLRLLDEEATWPAFQALAEQQGLEDIHFLHIASHAFADMVSGRLSGLAFYDRDVWLDEIREGGPYPALVTLSACSGSKSRFFEGDEQIGLATTFLVSGARQVVASLWPIQDYEAANLMTLFYENLRAGYAVNSALALAQRKFVKEGKEILHWAGFRLTGLPK